ncbi:MULTISPECIES: hypothetical protein [Prauserella]|uniref:hypothetical protein n=1 Tax=Prauserella TaxID=142577 RepID=UPI00130543D5|nr:MULTISPECIES: hypothetical protein [Prauserella]
MYGKGISTAAGTGTAGTLAYTGLSTAWLVLAALMLIMAGVALVKLLPRKGQADL